ncbi:hypothetical protein HDV04_003891 [Boothiomyces sp. JEL0838]|nr:hypothetical protein HDV04_003891 [Boothiomyces sp. JEL0838]
MLALNNLRLVHHSEQYHGNKVSGPYFEGWYYKQTHSKGSLIFIVGIFLPYANQESELKSVTVPHAFIMAFRNPKTTQCLYYTYPPEELEYENKKEFGYRIKIRNSEFTESGFKVDLDPKDLKFPTTHEETLFLEKVVSERKILFPDLNIDQVKYERVNYAVKGECTFENSVRFPTSSLVPSVMGPFGYLPLLECYHGIVSLHHTLNGKVDFIHNGETDGVILDGEGYIEKDHGFNFPKSWIWVHTNCFNQSKGSCLLVSVANVPMLSDCGIASKLVSMLPYGDKIVSKFSFSGFLIILYDSKTKQTFNLSLYKFGKIKKLEFTFTDKQIMELQVVQGELELFVTTERILGTGVPLPGPAADRSGMVPLVEESIDVKVKVRLMKGDNVLFEDEGSEGGMEVVGRIDLLQQKTK